MASPKEENGTFHELNVNVEDLTKDILDRFPDIGITQSNIYTPTSEIVIRVLMAYLNETFHCQIPQQICDQETPDLYPEVYQNIQLVSHLHSAFSIILQTSHFDDLSFSDFIHPSSNRTKLIFAVTENFARFCDMKANDFKPIYEGILDRKETHMSLVAKNEQLRQDLNNRASNRAQREANTKELLKEQKARKIELERLFEKQKIVTEEESQILSEVQKLKQQCESLSEQGRGVDKDISTLNKQVVSNAEELTKKLQERKQRLALGVADVKETNEELQSRKANIKLFENMMEGQKNRTKMLKDINVLASYLQERENYILSKKSEQQTLVEDIKRDQDTVTMKNENINQLQDQIVRLKLQENAKESQRKKSMTTLNKEYRDIKANHNKLLQQSVELDKSLRESQEKVKQLQETTLRVDQHIEKKFQDLVAEQDKFDEEVEENVLSIITALELQIKRENENN